MKVITAQEMQRIEDLSFAAHDSDHPQLFMEKAGKGIADFTQEYFLNNQRRLQTNPEDSFTQITLLCAKGNNSGDAYVAGCHLLDFGHKVIAIQITPLQNSSELCQKYAKKFSEKGGKIISAFNELPELPEKGIAIDGLLGTGFRGYVKPQYAKLIQAVNQATLDIISIDIPSGLSATEGVLSGKEEGNDPHIIHANETVLLGLAKLGYFLGQAINYTGRLQIVDFGLEREFIDQAKAKMIYIDAALSRSCLPKIKESRHKYEAGTVTAFAGSMGMSGAAKLSCLAAMRSGCGLVKLLHPTEINHDLAFAAPELIKHAYTEQQQAKDLINLFTKSSAAIIGPGLGQSDRMKILVSEVLGHLKIPTVLDADALNFFAHNAFSLPKQTVMTPHMGEMLRLLRDESKPKIDWQFLRRCQSYCENQQVTLILKGAPTFIFSPGKIIHVSLAGDPGMATAGSGDVLAGIIGAFLAQGLNAHKASILGVYIHAKAGEHAAALKTSYAMIASDIIASLPSAFADLI